jgi:putative membrane protein
MVHWLLSLILTAVLLLAIAHLVRGFELDGFGAAVIAAVVIGFVNATLGLVLRILTFPLTLLTFGLFLLALNAMMLKLAAALVPGFRIRGCWPALLAAVLLSVANALLGR